MVARERVVPRMQLRSIRRRPMRPEYFTASGQQIICATEKHEVAKPTIGAEAPMPRMWSGSVLMAMPSPRSCTKTESVMGSTSGGSRSSSAAAAAAAAETAG